jgi:serine/threonine protein kinase
MHHHHHHHSESDSPSFDLLASIPNDISPFELQYGQRIGKGQYGTVYLGKCRGIQVAIKKLNDVNLDEETLEDFRKEVNILRCGLFHADHSLRLRFEISEYITPLFSFGRDSFVRSSEPSSFVLYSQVTKCVCVCGQTFFPPLFSVTTFCEVAKRLLLF